MASLYLRVKFKKEAFSEKALVYMFTEYFNFKLIFIISHVFIIIMIQIEIFVFIHLNIYMFMIIWILF